MISQIHNEILKQKNVTGNGLEGTQKLLKAFLGVLAVKYKQSGLSKKADTVLDYE